MAALPAPFWPAAQAQTWWLRTPYGWSTNTSTSTNYGWPGVGRLYAVPAAPLLRGLKLARAHLAALSGLDPPADPALRPRAVAPAATGRPWASSREHRLRPGSRRRARAWIPA